MRHSWLRSVLSKVIYRLLDLTPTSNSDALFLPVGTVPGDVTNIIVLIHGTWGAPRWRSRKQRIPPTLWWTRESMFCKEVACCLQGSVAFKPFTWSGENTFRARQDASERLVSCLQQVRREFPTARIHAIAHSHGGNILCYALNRLMADSADATPVNSVVFLSVPFIHFTPRLIDPLLEERLRFAQTPLALFAAASMGSWLYETDILAWVSMHTLLIARIVMLLATFLLGCIEVGRHLLKKADASTAAQLTKAGQNADYGMRFQCPEKLNCPVLILRSTQDEASGVLGVLPLIANVGSMLLYAMLLLVPSHFGFGKRASDVRDLWRPLTRCGWAAGALGLLALGTVAAMRDTTHFVPTHELQQAIRMSCAVGISLIGLPLIVYLGFTPIIYALCLLMDALARAFGAQGRMAGVIIKISAEATPPGLWQVTQLPAAAEPLVPSVTPSHSTHSNPEALKVVSQWLALQALHKFPGRG
jgi:hypothetical protein